MSRVLLDTNVVLDFLLAREPFADAARAIWRACEQEKCIGYVFAISVTTIWYIGRKSVGASAARQHIADLLKVLQVCPVDAQVIASAWITSIADFEDAVQIASALSVGVDLIVTRNGGDFVGSRLPVLTPDAFLLQLAATPSEK